MRRICRFCHGNLLDLGQSFARTGEYQLRPADREERFLNCAASAACNRWLTMTYVDELRQRLQCSEKILLRRLRVQELQDGHRDLDCDVIEDLTGCKTCFRLIQKSREHKS